MLERDRSTAGVRDVPITPVHQPDEHRLEIHPFASKVVLETGRMRLVQALVDQAVLDQSLQACREDVAGDAEVLLDLIEPVRTQKELAQQQHAPGVAEDIQRTGDGAGGGIEVGVGSQRSKLYHSGLRMKTLSATVSFHEQRTSRHR